MGIDVYLRWDDMTAADEEAQYTGFDIHKGETGYLREAYHGEPYATMVLISEDWENQPKKGFKIKNDVLKARLPDVIKACKERSFKLYKSTEDEQEEDALAFKHFVKLHEKLEKAGMNPRILISY